MKIALVSETFPPEINGVAMTLGHLVEGLARRGHALTVVRPRQSRLDAPIPGALHREILCPSLPIPGYPFLRFGLPARSRLLRTWRADPPDLVHIATEGPLGWSALSAAHRLRLPLSSTFHTNFHQYSRHYGAAWLTRPVLAYLRWFHNRTRLTLSPSPDLNAELTRDGFANVALLSRGVNTRVFHPDHRDPDLRRQWGVGPRDLAVIHVSRLAAEKNYPLVLSSFEAIRTRLPSARFIIVSDGPLRRRLQRHHPWITFTGFLPLDDLARHYASADLFPYASQTETFGNVVTEALASGLPLVAYDYAAAARYVVSGHNGFLAPFGDANTFLQHTLSLAQDPSLRQRFSTHARATAEPLSWDPIVAGLETDLLALVSPARP